MTLFAINSMTLLILLCQITDDLKILMNESEYDDSDYSYNDNCGEI